MINDSTIYSSNNILKKKSQNKRMITTDFIFFVGVGGGLKDSEKYY